MKLQVKYCEKLKGSIKVSGSKNASLALMACCLLTNEEIELRNFPSILDTRNMLKILQDIGVKVKYNFLKHTLNLKTIQINPNHITQNMKKLRASYYIMGGFVANRLNFTSYYPGGCSFMNRPIDYHLSAFEKLGYEIEKDEDCIKFKALNIVDLPITIELEKPSIGATINILISSVKRFNKTIIHNPSLEPEVIQVIELLNKMGAYIKYNDKEIIIKGVEKLHGTKFKIMSDRIEAGSYLLLALAHKNSKVALTNVESKNLEAVISTIRNMGGVVNVKENSIQLISPAKINKIDTIIDIYPSFPTDLQQILTVVCTKAEGTSTIIDNIYSGRFSQVKELKKAGCIVDTFENKITINKTKLKGTILEAQDLRCGFACIVIGTIASNLTIIEKSENIFRGYEKILAKLRKIGISIKKIE